MGKTESTDLLITHIIDALEDVKAEDIQILDLREIENSVCSYFIVCSGNSNTQVNALAGSVQKKVSKALKEKPFHVEGTETAEWVLLDYINVVVHIFQRTVREYYDIESLWGDAKVTAIASNY
ncbi:MAG: ribosome silencing factor [Flavobacteriaceae bacterium]|jgi:ribosome-associated protein|nr:ribosome silencing factor [Flavobacteriaceae bacterium]MDG0967830.1 ribosome silencing factor [Flavobacteriaceae bacterium]